MQTQRDYDQQYRASTPWWDGQMMCHMLINNTCSRNASYDKRFVIDWLIIHVPMLFNIVFLCNITNHRSISFDDVMYNIIWFAVLMISIHYTEYRCTHLGHRMKVQIGRSKLLDNRSIHGYKWIQPYIWSVITRCWFGWGIGTVKHPSNTKLISKLTKSNSPECLSKWHSDISTLR